MFIIHYIMLLSWSSMVFSLEISTFLRNLNKISCAKIVPFNVNELGRFAHCLNVVKAEMTTVVNFFVGWKSHTTFPWACAFEMRITWLYWSHTRRRWQKGILYPQCITVVLCSVLNLSLTTKFIMKLFSAIFSDITTKFSISFAAKLPIKV